MKSKKLPNVLNPELNPQNASIKGYRFVENVIDPYAAVREVLELAEKEGYTFGASANQKGKLGLYKKEE